MAITKLKTKRLPYKTPTEETIAGKIDEIITHLNTSSPVAYKKYVALLSQSGTAAPTATVFENTLGGTLVWTRTAAGKYAGTLTGAFPTGKMVPIISFRSQDVEGEIVSVSLDRTSDDAVSLWAAPYNTKTPADDSILNLPIEIRVYP